MSRTNNIELRAKTINILKASGYTNREVAEALSISASIVSKYDRRHHFNSYYKTNVKNA